MGSRRWTQVIINVLHIKHTYTQALGDMTHCVLNQINVQCIAQCIHPSQKICGLLSCSFNQCELLVWSLSNIIGR